MLPRHMLHKYLMKNKCSSRPSSLLGQYPGETQLSQHKPTKKAQTMETEIMPFTLHSNFTGFTHACDICLRCIRFPPKQDKMFTPKSLQTNEACDSKRGHQHCREVKGRAHCLGNQIARINLVKEILAARLTD